MKFNTKGLKPYLKYMEGLDEKNISLTSPKKSKTRPQSNLIVIQKNDIIDEINKNKNFLPDIDKNILIHFKNFSTIEYSIDNKISTFLKKSVMPASYEPSKNLISARRNFLENKTGIYPELKKRNLYDHEIMNFVILHEIGHSIHDTINKNGAPFVNLNSPEANFINSFTGSLSEEWFSNHHAIMRKTNNSVAEGFADLYSSIIINELYPKNQSKRIIEAIYSSRKFLADHNNDDYNTYPSIEALIQNNKNNLSPFRNYKEVEDFIFKTSLKTLYNFLATEMDFSNDTLNQREREREREKGISYFAGVLYESHRLEENKITPTTKQTWLNIINNIGFSNNFTNTVIKESIYYPHHEQPFNEGREEYKKIKNKNNKLNFKSRVKLLKSHFLGGGNNIEQYSSQARNKFK